MSDPHPENLGYTLLLTYGQVNEAITNWLTKQGKIPPDDAAEIHIEFHDRGHRMIDVRACVRVKVYDSKALVNILKDDAEED